MKLIDPNYTIPYDEVFDVDVLCIPCDSVRFRARVEHLTALELDGSQFISFLDCDGNFHAIKVANIAKITVSPVKE